MMYYKQEVSSLYIELKERTKKRTKPTTQNRRQKFKAALQAQQAGGRTPKREQCYIISHICYVFRLERCCCHEDELDSLMKVISKSAGIANCR